MPPYVEVFLDVYLGSVWVCVYVCVCVCVHSSPCTRSWAEAICVCRMPVCLPWTKKHLLEKKRTGFIFQTHRLVLGYGWIMVEFICAETEKKRYNIPHTLQSYKPEQNNCIWTFTIKKAQWLNMRVTGKPFLRGK